MLLLNLFLFAAFIFLIYKDYAGTVAYLALGGKEANPLLGPTPSKQRMILLQIPSIVLYGALVYFAHAGVWSLFLPIPFLLIGIAIKANVVRKNAKHQRTLEAMVNGD